MLFIGIMILKPKNIRCPAALYVRVGYILKLFLFIEIMISHVIAPIPQDSYTIFVKVLFFRAVRSQMLFRSENLATYLFIICDFGQFQAVFKSKIQNKKHFQST